MNEQIDSTKVILSSKGQLAIPKRFRKALGMELGSEVQLTLKKDGTLELAPVRSSITEIFGMMSTSRVTTLTIEEMDEAIMQAVKEENGL